MDHKYEFREWKEARKKRKMEEEVETKEGKRAKNPSAAWNSDRANYVKLNITNLNTCSMLRGGDRWTPGGQVDEGREGGGGRWWCSS